MTDINIRYVTDNKDNAYYPITHIDAVEGFDLLEFEDMANIKEDLNNVWDQSNNTSGQLSSLQNKLSSLESTISNMVKDTGWINMELLNNTIPYGSTSVPQVRMISFNGVSFITLKGALKGLTSNNMDIAKVPNEIAVMLKSDISFAQNMSVSSGTAHFTRMSLKSDGILKIERATLSAVTEAQWFPIDMTAMI